MRASIAAENAGVPTASIVSSFFAKQGRAIAEALGMSNIAIAEYPGVIMTDSIEELRSKVENILADHIVEGLTRSTQAIIRNADPKPRDIVFNGSLEEVQEYFHDNLWTDGLPIIPPTVEKVQQFLCFTNRSPDELIGVMLPENREATIWTIAVNGVMAGCRPEYMPVLIAIVEAIADPEFRIEDAGSTPGWEPLIIINGPVNKDLDFNFESGVMRTGRRANTSIGRFLRLYMRNVAGLRIPPGRTDKGTIAYSFNVVLAENEEAVKELGWEPYSVDRGFQSGDNVVTVQSVIYTSPPTYSGGSTALEHLETIAEVIGRQCFSYWVPLGAGRGKLYPLILMSPGVARIIARDGWTKNDIRKYLFEKVKAPAGKLEKLAWQIGLSDFSFCQAVRDGTAPPAYCESEDPERMVPVFLKPEWIGIVVSGDAGRNQSKGYMQNHKQGFPVSKKIEMIHD